jgi:hypothetical protein
MTPEAGRVAVEEAGERPYERAMEHLKRHHGIKMSKRFLEKLTQMVGEFWLQGDDGEAQRCLSDKGIPLAEVACERCCVLADGTRIAADAEWHEIRVGTVCGTEGQRTRKSSMARFGDVERFGLNLWRKACQYGYRGASLEACLGDGSFHILRDHPEESLLVWEKRRLRQKQRQAA